MQLNDQGSTAQAIDIVEVPPARDQPCQGLTANGRQPVIEAVAKLSSWLSSGEAVARVARHLSCTLLAPRSVPAKSASLAVCDV
jgi:uncharacterized protein YoaH (UPF0181 family)